MNIHVYIKEIYLINTNKKNDIKINEAIIAPLVIIINEIGKTLGEFSIGDALNLAEQRNFDLVEIQPNASPPICRLLDYGKFKYQYDKKRKLTNKSTKKPLLHEIRFRPNIDDHDFDVKFNKIKEFILHGAQVKVVIRFRGREMEHIHSGVSLITKITKQLDNIARLDKSPTIENKTMTVMLFPNSQ